MKWCLLVWSKPVAASLLLLVLLLDLCRSELGCILTARFEISHASECEAPTWISFNNDLTRLSSDRVLSFHFSTSHGPLTMSFFSCLRVLIRGFQRLDPTQGFKLALRCPGYKPFIFVPVRSNCVQYLICWFAWEQQVPNYIENWKIRVKIY